MQIYKQQTTIAQARTVGEPFKMYAQVVGCSLKAEFDFYRLPTSPSMPSGEAYKALSGHYGLRKACAALKGQGPALGPQAVLPIPADSECSSC